MATIYVQLDPQSAIPAASNGAQHDIIAGSVNPVPVLAFDQTTSESVYWTFSLQNYGTGNFSLAVEWRSLTSTTTSHTARWGAAIARATPNTTTAAVGSIALGTAIEAADDVLGATAGRDHQVALADITVADVVNGDLLTVQLYRDVADAGDDLAEDAYVFMAVLSYEDD